MAMIMDGRSITSKYNFSESDSESIHSGKGQIARSMSLARRSVSTVSLFSLAKKQDGGLARGKVMGSTAPSESFWRKTSHHGSVLEPPQQPRKSYMFSIGNESHDGLVEIIPESRSEHYNEQNEKHDSLVEITPATPICQSEAQSMKADEAMSYGQWIHSTLPVSHPAVKPGTCASSIYSQDDRGSEYFEYASSIHVHECDELAEAKSLIPDQLRLRTRSLLSLAKKYSSDDDASIYSRYCCGTAAPVPDAEGFGRQADDCSVYSRDEITVPIHRYPDTRAETMGSTASLPISAMNSCKSKPLPPLPTERDQQTWLSPASSGLPRSPVRRDSRSKEMTTKNRASADSSVLPSPLNFVKRSVSKSSESAASTCSQPHALRHRLSSWSWLSIDIAMGEQSSTTGDKKSSESSISHGQRYLQVSSIRRASVGCEMSPESVAPYPVSLSPKYSGIYRGEPGDFERGDTPPPVPPGMRSEDGRKAARQDLLKLPPLQLPELPGEQRVLFYARCGHLETSMELPVIGPELPGWCPVCLKGRSRKRRTMSLKSILKSIAE